MTTVIDRKRDKPCGFSLVEILVAVAILATLMTMLFAFFSQATNAWQSTEKKMSAFREARAAFYYLRRDLSSMVVSNSVKWSFHEDTSNLFNEPDLPPQANGDAIVFLSSTPRQGQNQNESKSDLCLVGYYLAYRQTSTSQPHNITFIATSVAVIAPGARRAVAPQLLEDYWLLSKLALPT